MCPFPPFLFIIGETVSYGQFCTTSYISYCGNPALINGAVCSPNTSASISTCISPPVPIGISLVPSVLRLFPLISGKVVFLRQRKASAEGESAARSAANCFSSLFSLFHLVTHGMKPLVARVAISLIAFLSKRSSISPVCALIVIIRIWGS